MTTWLIDETQTMDAAAIEGLLRASTTTRGPSKAALAVRVNDIVIRDTKKWFGGADIRLDAIVVQGLPKGSAANQSFYQPSTFRFSGIHDGNRLPIDPPGLLIFYGRPAYFLDISILASRDRRDSEHLGRLIASRLNSDEWKAAGAALLSLALAAPQVATLTAAIGSAATVGNLAAELLHKATGNTIGLYRVSWLQHHDRFGLGRHPAAGAYRQQDLSFWYEIVLDRSPSTELRIKS
jgi:hypothetical protein